MSAEKGEKGIHRAQEAWNDDTSQVPEIDSNRNRVETCGGDMRRN